MSATITALLSLLTGVTVAVVGHLLTAHRARRDDLAAQRLKAYGDFIQAASRLVAARRLGKTENELEELAVLNDAKARICICAEAPVVEALAEFWHTGGTLEREREILAFTQLCERMRESLGNRRNNVAGLRLSDTLFRLEPSLFSYRAERLAPVEMGQQDVSADVPKSRV